MMLQLASIEAFSKVLSHPSWDLLVIVFFLIFGFFYGMFAGLKKLLAGLFSTYISILLFEHFNYLDFFTQNKKVLEIFLFRTAAFLTIVTLLGILLGKTVFIGSKKKGEWWKILILSFLEIGLLISAILRLLPIRELLDFSPIMETAFASNNSFFWWLTLPLISLFFIRKKPE